jgi:hypothetical protein
MLHCMDVRQAAADQGFVLDEKPLDHRWVWVWRHGDDDRRPCFLTEREALRYMEDRLRQIAIFE